MDAGKHLHRHRLVIYPVVTFLLVAVFFNTGLVVILQVIL